jgi:hypothetical protein
MTVHYDTCEYSTVKNTSGGRMKFGFLPPHGRELAANEEFTVFGSIYEAVVRMERVTSRRNIQALEAALDRGDLTILTTPAPILTNAQGHPKMLTISDDNLLTTTDPCWTSSL